MYIILVFLLSINLIIIIVAQYSSFGAFLIYYITMIAVFRIGLQICSGSSLIVITLELMVQWYAPLNLVISFCYYFFFLVFSQCLYH